MKLDLKQYDKKFWAATFTLSGAVIGAGILGLPYVFSKSGFLIGLMWIMFLGVILILIKLALGEVALRTKGKHQLAGYAEKYLGKWAKRFMVFAVVFGIYSALLAYLIGEGESFSHLLFGHTNFALYFAVGFWLIMTILLQKGLNELKKIETWGVLGILFLILAIVVWFAPNVQVSNLLTYDFSYFFLPFGVVLFALLGFSSIPEVRLEIKGKEKQLKKVIIIGSVIPIIVYILFSLIFVGVLDGKIPEVATLGFGNLVVLFGIFTMLTSYFVLSFVLKDMAEFDLKMPKSISFIFVSIIPLALYFLASFFNIAGFIRVLGIGGVVAGGLIGILILFMHKKAKKFGDRKPEFKIRLPWILVWLFSLMFIVGIVLELFF